MPVIGSAVGGIPESIDDGATGFIYEPGNAVELSRRMARLLNDPALRKVLGTAALAKAQEYLAPRRAAEYAEFLGRIVAGRRETLAS